MATQTAARPTGKGWYPLPPVVDPAVKAALDSLNDQRDLASGLIATEKDAKKRRRLQAAIDNLSAILFIVDQKQIVPNFSRAGLGTKVTYLDPDYTDPQVIHILRSGSRTLLEDNTVISLDATMAECFTGHVPGDEVECCSTKYTLIAVERSEYTIVETNLVSEAVAT